MLCLSDFELYSRWVPLLYRGVDGERIIAICLVLSDKF